MATTPNVRPDSHSQPQSAVYVHPAQTQQMQPPRPQSQSQPAPPTLQYYTQQLQQNALMTSPQYTPLTPSAVDKGKGREHPSGPTLSLSTIAHDASATAMRYPLHQQQQQPVLSLSHGALSLHGGGQNHMRLPVPMSTTVGMQASAAGAVAGAAEDEDDADELPVMSDDVYGQGLLWQSQSKDNLKVLMDNFTSEQFERYEAYRRSALPKQSVRKVVQQCTNYTISQPVAQIVAGFAKVFVGEIVEKARNVQTRMGEPADTPLSPEHLREAYRLYQEETGRVGAARVHRGKKLFVR